MVQVRLAPVWILVYNSIVLIYGQSSTGPDTGLPILPTPGPIVVTTGPTVTGPAVGTASSIIMSPCPAGAQPLTDSGGLPRKCLPRHSEMCNSADACCYFNQVDYFCCTGVSSCPSFGNVTLVIYRGMNPGAGGSPYESFFAQVPRANVPNFDQYPGVRGPAPSYGGSPASVAPPQPYPAPPPPPPPPPPPAYPSPAPSTSAPIGYPTPAPAPPVGYGGNVPVINTNNNKLCPTCMGQQTAPVAGQVFIPIMPDTGVMHFVVPQGNALCPTCGTSQTGGGGYGGVAPIPAPSSSYGGPAPIPSPSYSSVPISAQPQPQPSPSYGSQPVPGPPIAPQPNVLCPTCNKQSQQPIQPNVVGLPSGGGGYGVNPSPPPPLQPIVPVVPQPSYGGGGGTLPATSQPNVLCPTCGLQPNLNQPGISNINQPQTPLRYDGTGNLVSTGTQTNNAAQPNPVPSSYSVPAPVAPKPIPSTYSAPAPVAPQPIPSTYSAPAPVAPQPIPSTYSAPAPVVPQPIPSTYSAPAPSLQPSTGYGQPSGNAVNPLCPTCGLQPPPGMPFIAVQPGTSNSSMQFVMPQPGVLCPTCANQPTVVSSYPIPGPPSPRAYGGTIQNPSPSSYGGQPPIPNVVPSNSYSSVPSGFGPNLPPDQGFGVVPSPGPDTLLGNVTINPPPEFPPTQNNTFLPAQNKTSLPVQNPTGEWKPGGGFPPSKFGAGRRLPVLKALPAGENPDFLSFLRLLRDSNGNVNENGRRHSQNIQSNVWT